MDTRFTALIGISLALICLHTYPLAAASVSTNELVQDKVIIPHAKALVLVSDPTKLSEQPFNELTGLYTIDVAIPGDLAAFEAKLTPLFANKELKRSDLLAIKKSIAAHFKEHNLPAPNIKLPQQNAGIGVVQLIVEQQEAPPVTQEANSTPTIQGIVLLGSKDAVRKEGWEKTTGVVVLIPSCEEALSCRLAPFIENKITFSEENIALIKKEIVLYYREKNRPLTAVFVPEQEVSNGVLQLLVIESVLSEVTAVGNCWFKSCKLIDYMDLPVGEPIDNAQVAKNLSFINRNPFRSTDAIYKPGATPGTTDVELVTKDRMPLRFYAGAENTGLKEIGRQRFFVGCNWGNVFGLDHIFSYQYITATEPHKFQAHTASYTAPLSWKHIFSAYGGYSIIHAKMPFPGAKSKGQSGQLSVRYQMPFNPICTYLHELSVGYDFKRTNNNLEFVEQHAFFAGNANLTQFAFTYHAEYTTCISTTYLDASAFISPFTWLPDQSRQDFNELRLFAKPQYAYGTITLSEEIQLPGSTYLSAFLQGQLSDENLLPSEELGLGGYDTVRGYEERELNSDNGLLASTEFRSPKIHLLKCLGCNNLQDTLQFLAFLDYGLAINHKRLPGEPKSQYLLGVGPGMRYDIAPYLALRVDLGFKLHKNRNGESLSRVHFGLVASY